MKTNQFLRLLIIFFATSLFSQNIDTNLKTEIQKLLQLGAIVIDVRTPEEYQVAHYKGSLNIPYDVIETKINELSKYKDKPIILYCRSGRRSGIAKSILERHGFKKVINGVNLSNFPESNVVR
ncbi:MAG: rhodanese-like domain-containing protein [Leptospiraceae bacterium]|nr:rhodanese-like domain-containing protein [Leptospiraceae bacterium]MDW7976407.1 rhodanese-like domain-containing protein [Leptospiraceae bacterium]